MENLKTAWKQVRRNGGAGGVAGVKARELPPCPGEYLEKLTEVILSRKYQPMPAKRVDISKPDATKRRLNIPASRDRVVQACLANYPDYARDFDMSNGSYGLRKHRRCEQAILKGLEYMNEGYDWIVGIDRRKFFDTADQDRLVRLVDKTFQNSTLTALTRKFVTAKVMIEGETVKTDIGIPQGGPLSPVLANLYLDQAGKELAKRGLKFIRYADGLLGYVKSEGTANRVIKSFSRFLEQKLKLIVNGTKSRVDRPDGLKYPGLTFKRNWKTGKREARARQKSMDRLEEKIMELTRRSWGISLDERIARINQVIRGWCSCFQWAWIPKRFLKGLDQKIRRRTRAVLWKQWKTTARRRWSLMKLGCLKREAYMPACTGKSCTRCPYSFLNTFIKNEHLKRKGLQSVQEYFNRVSNSFHERTERTACCQMARWVV